MSDKEFNNLPLKIIEPKFGSELTSIVLELEKLRSLTISGTTNPNIFFEIKRLFQFLESIGSARIEGNGTTIAQFIETQLEERPYINEDIQEIRNIEKAMRWIDENAVYEKINRRFVSELHRMVVKDLTPPPDGEGDHDPGNYRSRQVEIQASEHLPPPPYLIDELMDDLYEFINKEQAPQYDLLKIALAHHRFMWIHPFGNGNGRTGRLFTYAMLVKTGFKVHVGQILNITAIFCSDRNKYYDLLSKADRGEEQDLENWCIYVLRGLDNEIRKIENLARADYVRDKLLKPALRYSKRMKYIDNEEFDILKLTAEKGMIKAADVKKIIKSDSSVTVSRRLKALREKNMLRPEKEGGNKYLISFVNSFLIRGIIWALNEEGYVAVKD